MKLTRKYNQIRRDCYCETECENCGYKEIDTGAYDDDNFWQNVIPNRKCKECDKSTFEMGIAPEKITTKYNQFEII